MIVCTGRDSCRAVYIPENYISKIEELSDIIESRAYPYTRVHITNPNDGFEYYLDVVESRNKILQLIEERKNEQK